jgi:phosphatidate cytidylyltransferase
MENLVSRTLTAAVFTVGFLGCILFGKYTFVFLCLVIFTGCLWEFYEFFKKTETPPMILRGFLLGLALFILTALYCLSFSKIPLFSFLAPLFFLFPISTLVFPRKENLVSSAITFWGIFYCVVPVCMFLWMGFIGSHGYSYHILLGFIFFIWVNDTGAYIFGNIFGKSTIYKKVSPGKTWEGFIGGAICAIVLGYFLTLYFHELNRIQWIVLAIIVVISGSLGDFVESLYKREINLKDSGKLFPGHGGMLDRFDSFLMAAPFVYFFLLLVKS